MTVYHIFTEQRDNLSDIVRHYKVQGFTILTGVGFYNGTQEECAMIIICGVFESTIHRIADRIKRINQQESVLVLKYDATTMCAGKSLG